MWTEISIRLGDYSILLELDHLIVRKEKIINSVKFGVTGTVITCSMLYHTRIGWSLHQVSLIFLEPFDI